MAVGTARPAQALRIGTLGALLCLTGAALAQEAGPPSLSKSCEVPAADISTIAPLPATIRKLRDRTRLKVIAIGSSSAAGLGASTYSSQFEGIIERAFKGLDVVVKNRGVSGEQAATTAVRLKTQVALENPDLVLWQVGTNDALARVPVASFTDTVRDTVGWLKEHRIDVVLVGLQYTPKVVRDEYYAAIRAALHKVALSENVLLVRRFEAMEFLDRIKAGETLDADGLHLNDPAYHCMAEHVARAVVVGAFLKASPAPPTR